MKKAYVGIYCKIGCDQFSDPPWCSLDSNKSLLVKAVSSKAIFDFLMADTGYAWDQENDKPLGGDKNIWTLCTNEKVGLLEIWDDPHCQTTSFDVSWGMGTHHVDKVKCFLAELQRRDILSSDHYSQLMTECQFAQDNFNIHYDITDYLIAVGNGKKWKKP